MLDQANRTFICSVVFIDLVGYSKKPVTEQIRLKTSLTNNLSEAIQDIPVNDRIILDTGDGAAISFLGDPEDALFVTLSLREKMIAEGMTATMVEASGEDSVRMGINLGPVKLVKDINGHPNIIGDGINVAQRIMSFARPGQIVVSRSYYDVVSNLASEYAKLFTYEGSRTDKHVREHEIYVVGHHEGALQKAKDGMKDRASSTTPNPRKAATARGHLHGHAHHPVVRARQEEAHHGGRRPRRARGRAGRPRRDEEAFDAAARDGDRAGHRGRADAHRGRAPRPPPSEAAGPPSPRSPNRASTPRCSSPRPAPPRCPRPPRRPRPREDRKARRPAGAREDGTR